MLNTRYNPLQQRSNGGTAVADPPVSTQPAQLSAPATTTPGPTRPGLKKVSLGAIAKKENDTTNKYPVYPDAAGTAGLLAARIAERQEQFDALKSSLETDKAELSRVLIRPWYLQHFHRKTDVPSSVLVNWQVPTSKACPIAPAPSASPSRNSTMPSPPKTPSSPFSATKSPSTSARPST